MVTPARGGSPAETISYLYDGNGGTHSVAYNGTTTTGTYGADGLRRSSTVNGVTTYYVYDGQTLIREMHKNVQTGALFNTATYFSGPNGPEYRRDDTPAGQEYDSQGRQVSKCRWYVYDGLGSVVGKVDPSGNLTSNPKYDVYGLVRSNPGTASSAMGFVGGLGHLSEASTGLIYMRARYYDPALGRFASQDPSQNGSNWFVYCGNNPVNQVDATGKSSSSLTDALTKLMWAFIIVGVIAAFYLVLVTFPPAAAALLELLMVVSVPLAAALVAIMPLTATAGAVALGLAVVVALCTLAAAEISALLSDQSQPSAPPESPDNNSQPSGPPQEYYA